MNINERCGICDKHADYDSHTCKRCWKALEKGAIKKVLEINNQKTLLVIGKSKEQADEFVKSLGLIGYKKILTRGEKSINTLDGVKVDKVYIYESCGDHAKKYAYYSTAQVIDGSVWIIGEKDEE